MTSTTCLTALALLTISSTLAALAESDRDVNSSEARNDITEPGSTKKKTPKCREDRDCQKGQICHTFLNVCFVMPQEKSRMKLKVEKKPTIPCKSDKDCGKSQSCHALFGCVDNPHIPATVTTAPQIRVPKCKNSTECPDGQYCHDFFNLCLPNLTIFFETTASPPRAGCKSDSDCENQGDFCHNLTRLCLPLPTTAITSPPRKSAYACNSHADCKMTEFCHFLIGMRSRDKSRGFGPNNNLKSALGVCIARALKDVPEDPSPFSSNCSHAADCGKGRCCLKDLGLCVGYRLPGELCVAEDVSFAFSCPCLQGFTCISRRRPMRLRRLERKLKLPKEVVKKLSLQFDKTNEFRVGKCQLISD